LYIVLDHTRFTIFIFRTIYMTISDGSLPSNVGGGANVRNILRRVFAIIKKNNWSKILDLVIILCFYIFISIYNILYINVLIY